MEWKSKKQFKYELAEEKRKNEKLEQKLMEIENISIAFTREANLEIGKLKRDKTLLEEEKEELNLKYEKEWKQGLEHLAEIRKAKESRDEWIEAFYEEKDKLISYYTEELKVKDKKNDLLEKELNGSKEKIDELNLSVKRWRKEYYYKKVAFDIDLKDNIKHLNCRIEELEMLRAKERLKFGEITLKKSYSIHNLRQARRLEQARTEEDKKHLKEEIVGLKLQLRRKEHLLEVRKGVIGILERSNKELSKALETTRKKNKNLNNLFLKEIVGVELEKELKKRAWTSIAYVRD